MNLLLGTGFVVYGALVYLLEAMAILGGFIGISARVPYLLLVVGAACAGLSYYLQLWLLPRGGLNDRPAMMMVMVLIAASWLAPLVVMVLMIVAASQHP